MNSTLAELGMDSMTAVEIKQALEGEFEIFLTPKEIRNLTFARLDTLLVVNQCTEVDKQQLEGKHTFFFIRPMRGDCKLTGTLCLMCGYIILSDKLHHSSLRLFHIGISSLNNNIIRKELGFMWISSIS